MSHADEQERKRLRGVLVIVHDENATRLRGRHAPMIARPMPVREMQNSP
jgi:hypothetical protein